MVELEYLHKLSTHLDPQLTFSKREQSPLLIVLRWCSSSSTIRLYQGYFKGQNLTLLRNQTADLPLQKPHSPLLCYYFGLNELSIFQEDTSYDH